MDTAHRASYPEVDKYLPYAEFINFKFVNFESFLLLVLLFFQEILQWFEEQR